MMQIKAALTEQQHDAFAMTQLQLADPKADEVRVRIVATGVCHTDVAGRDQDIVPYPVVLGHEGAGVVEAVGTSVAELHVGDHVVLSFAHCGTCSACLTGHPSVCTNFNPLNFGGGLSDGTSRLCHHGQMVANFFGQSSFASHVVVKSHHAVAVDKQVDLALLGPLGCGIQTGAGTVLNRLRPKFASSLVVYGAGSVGLSAIMAASIVGCQHLIAVDVNPQRLALAKQLGATHTIQGDNTAVVDTIKQLTGGGSHYAIETTGVPALVKQSLQALRPLGTSAVVGITPEIRLDVHNDLMAEGKSLIGVIEGDAVPRVFIPQLIDYYQAGRFPFDRLVRRYDFADINQAFADMKQGTVIKPVVVLDNANNQSR